jgi:hypothetical protein
MFGADIPFRRSAPRSSAQLIRFFCFGFAELSFPVWEEMTAFPRRGIHTKAMGAAHRMWMRKELFTLKG